MKKPTRTVMAFAVIFLIAIPAGASDETDESASGPTVESHVNGRGTRNGRTSRTFAAERSRVDEDLD